MALTAILLCDWHHEVPDSAAWISRVGGEVMTISLLPAVVGFRHLGPWLQPHATNGLVTHGISRCLRHPPYLSLIRLAVERAARRHSWPALLATALLLTLHRKAAHGHCQRPTRYSDYSRTSECFLPRRRA